MENMDRLFQLMKERCITASQLSNDTGISTGNISDWKSGRSKPSIDKLITLSRYFNVSIDYLTGTSDFQKSDKEYNIGNRIKQLRRSLDVSSSQFAASLGIPISALYAWENNRALPTIDKILKMIELYDCGNYLLGLSQQLGSDSNQRKTALPSKCDSDEVILHDKTADRCFLKLRKELEPYNITEADIDFILTVFKAHKRQV